MSGRRRVGWSVALGACAALFAGCDEATAPDPGGEPAAWELIFEGVLAGVPEVLAVDPSTGGVRRLFPAGTTASWPRPSPDGTRVLFVVADYQSATGDLFVADRDGSGITRLTDHPALDDQPTWSPDGCRVAFRSYRTGRDGDIWVLDLDDGSLVNLTPDPLPGVTDERHPAWSPDGRRIAFVTNAGGNYDLWTMAADGTDRRRLTETAELDAEPAWSPDGSVLAFRRSGDGVDIHLIGSSGGVPVRLAVPGVERMPVWTPDGTGLVVVHHDDWTARPDLYRMAPDGTGLEPVVTDEVPGGSLAPAFLPVPDGGGAGRASPTGPPGGR